MFEVSKWLLTLASLTGVVLNVRRQMAFSERGVVPV